MRFQDPKCLTSPSSLIPPVALQRMRRANNEEPAAAAASHPLLDNPPGSPRSSFMLMMHQRIEALEVQRVEHEAQIAALTKVVEYESRREYDAVEESFSDGCSIDWFIREPLDTMHVISESMSPWPMSESHWDAKVRLPVEDYRAKTVQLSLPVERDGTQTHAITLPVELTVRELFTAIHAFYDTPITAKDLAEHVPDDDNAGVQYRKNAMGRLLLGSG